MSPVIRHLSLVSLGITAMSLPAAVLAADAAAAEVAATAVDTAAADASADGVTRLGTVEVKAQRLEPNGAAPGQSSTTVDREQFRNQPGASIAELLVLSPGVTFVQGNGPRDVSVSVRGSNTRQTFGVRNIKVFEDGFAVTQPDGLARTDLTDPHAYGAIDVVRGPSSAYFGNYATGGSINFNLRRGRDLDGIEVGLDGGSNRYLNAYAIGGGKNDLVEYTAFLGNVRGSSDTAHSSYFTTTINTLATFTLGERDRLVVKFINNDLDADLPLRLSLNQYYANPYQQGCSALTGVACASVSVLPNGFNGTRVAISPEQAGLRRNDRRTIVGARWEHDFDAITRVSSSFVFDNRDITQPTSATAAIGVLPSFNLSSDLSRGGRVFGLPSEALFGVFYNSEKVGSGTFNVTNGGGATIGGQTQQTAGTHANYGFRLREQLALTPQFLTTVGLGGEITDLDARVTNFTYPANASPTSTRINGARKFYNLAPELALQYAVNEAWTLRTRFGGGYGTPQAGNLFVTAQGTPGNNVSLAAQKNYGIDVGTDVRLGETLTASVTGFYEFFCNELVTQSAGANLQNFTFNAPRSEHRGVEVTADWHPLPRLLPGAHLTAAYLYNNQIYTQYSERLSAGNQSTVFSRDGNRIPGVQPQYLNARLVYDQPNGVLEGVGGFVEFNFRESQFVDNANLLKVPGYTLVNLNLHYNPPANRGWLSRVTVYAALQNLFDETYVGSASNIANSINANTGLQNGETTLRAATGSIYAGAGRLFYTGLRVRF